MKKILFALLAIVAAFSASTALAETKTAILAGGCFWCVESDFEKLDGVLKATSGYTGGTISNPTYKNHHDTDEGQVPHVEAVKIEYDSKQLSYGDILQYYFYHIDPTDGEGQFCDRGASYRPVIFVESNAQRSGAEAAKRVVKRILGTDINVDILDAKKFWPAEDYHQDFAKKNPARYELYRWRCGRDSRVEELWGDK